MLFLFVWFFSIRIQYTSFEIKFTLYTDHNDIGIWVKYNQVVFRNFIIGDIAKQLL